MRKIYNSIAILFTVLIVSSIPQGIIAAPAATASVCQFAGGNSGCSGCMNNGKGVWTAFGCITTDASSFVGEILRIGIGIGGGVAFLLILFGGFQILTSAGNPEQLTAGRELVSSAIAGLLVIILSIFLLRLVGVNILGIPGFS